MTIRKADAAAIVAAAEHIRAGRLVAFPTETVYGLGADATNGRAVAEIFAAKGRPRFNPLIVHVTGKGEAERYVEPTPLAERLMARFWPGPMTLVLKRRADCGLSDLVSAGLDTVAIRMPKHDVAQALLTAAGKPLAAPSANLSGHVSATSAEHVAADLGDAVAMILDAGPTVLGLESTVVDATGKAPVLLRPGGVTVAEIEAAAGAGVVRGGEDHARPNSPGQLASHYAPAAHVRLEAGEVLNGEALLAFGPGAPVTKGPVINLSPSGDLKEAAANLFAALRALDATGATTIAVMPIPDEGVGEAINDRLRRAAVGR